MLIILFVLKMNPCRKVIAMSAFVTFNPLIPVLICSMSGLAYGSNQKRQRMSKPRSCRLVVLVLHRARWLHREQGGVGHIFSCDFAESEARLQSFARSMNPRHYLRTTRWPFTVDVLNIPWQSDEPRPLITVTHLPFHLKHPETEGGSRSLIELSLFHRSPRPLSGEGEFAAVGACSQMEDSV